VGATVDGHEGKGRDIPIENPNENPNAKLTRELRRESTGTHPLAFL